jgi:hypothetical protein
MSRHGRVVGPCHHTSVPRIFNTSWVPYWCCVDRCTLNRKSGGSRAPTDGWIRWKSEEQAQLLDSSSPARASVVQRSRTKLTRNTHHKAYDTRYNVICHKTLKSLNGVHTHTPLNANKNSDNSFCAQTQNNVKKLMPRSRYKALQNTAVSEKPNDL